MTFPWKSNEKLIPVFAIVQEDGSNLSSVIFSRLLFLLSVMLRFLLFFVFSGGIYFSLISDTQVTKNFIITKKTDNSWLDLC
jgi:hypothetical protein